MLVVFEGPSGAGKTTLLHAVYSRLLDLQQFRRSAPVVLTPYTPRPASASGEWPHAEVTHAVYGALRCCDFYRRDVLVDRLWVSDIVGASVYARSDYDREYVRPGRDFRYVAVVHVTVADWNVLRARSRHGEGSSEVQTLEVVHKEFESYFSSTPSKFSCDVVRVETDGGSSPSQCASFVVGSLLAIERRVG